MYRMLLFKREHELESLYDDIYRAAEAFTTLRYSPPVEVFPTDPPKKHLALL